MSQYYGRTLSNTVTVSDVDKFEQLITSIPADGKVSVDKDEEHRQITFYCDGGVSLDDAIPGIQQLLSDDSTLIVHEVGYEGFRDIYADAYIISNKFVDFMNFNNIVEERARDLKKVISFKYD